MSWLNGHASWVFAAGLLVVVSWQAWSCSRDIALARRVRASTRPPARLSATPKVSVLVAAWNEAPIVREHVLSFLELRYPRKELVLCAGGKDGTYEIAREYCGSQVTVLQQHAGDGKQASLQRCFEESSGALVYLTDADCLMSDEALERCLEPIINEGESAATGTSWPLTRQRSHPLVLHRWFGTLYGAAHSAPYAGAVLGRNAAVRRDVVVASGGFVTGIQTGTDYHLGKQIHSNGHRIAFVSDSSVQTRYAETLPEYWRQQARWQRNVMMHGMRFGAYREVALSLVPSVLGVLMLTGPIWVLWLGPAALVLWSLLWAHALLSRVRYVRFGNRLLGLPRASSSYLLVPAYLLLDLALWCLPPLQLLSQEWRNRW